MAHGLFLDGRLFIMTRLESIFARINKNISVVVVTFENFALGIVWQLN